MPHATAWSRLQHAFERKPPSQWRDLLVEAGRIALLGGRGREALQLWRACLDGPYASKSPHDNLTQFMHQTGDLVADLMIDDGVQVDWPWAQTGREQRSREATLRCGQQLRDSWSGRPLPEATDQPASDDDPDLLRWRGARACDAWRTALASLRAARLQDAWRELAVAQERQANLQQWQRVGLARLQVVLALDLDLPAQAQAALKRWAELDESRTDLTALACWTTPLRLILDGALKERFAVDEACLAACLDRASQPAPATVSPPVDWAAFLRRWPVCQRREPATKRKVQALERRLGVTLPISYRALLLVTDGLALDDFTPALLPAHEVGWLRDVIPDWLEWVNLQDGAQPDSDWDVFGQGQDWSRFPTHHLPHVLQVSAEFNGAVYVLDPLRRRADGEWEAWLLDPRLPGAVRYPCLAELLELEAEHRGHRPEG
jgi:hypothetical protein